MGNNSILYVRVLISVIIMMVGLLTLSQVKLKNYRFIIWVLILSLVLTLIGAINETLAGIVSAVGLAIFIFKCGIPLLKSIGLAVSTFLIVILSDYICSLIIRNVFNLNKPIYELVDENIVIYILVSIMVLTLVFIISKAITILFNIKTFFDGNLKLLEFLGILISIITFGVVYAIVRVLDNQNSIIDFGIYLICYSALGITMIIMYSYAKRDICLRAKEKEQENLKRYTEELEVLCGELNRVMHENNNIMLTMFQYIETNNMTELAKYFNDKIIKYKKKHVVDQNNLRAISKIKQPEIKSLIYCKVIEANEKNLKPIVDICSEVLIEDVEIIDLSRIIGILIDNAIEASVKCENPLMKVGIIDKKDITVIVVINSCPDDIPPLYKLFSGEFSTKNKTGKGYGLTNLTKIVNSYSNVCIKTEIKDNIISQCIEIAKQKQISS